MLLVVGRPRGPEGSQSRSGYRRLDICYVPIKTNYSARTDILVTANDTPVVLQDLVDGKGRWDFEDRKTSPLVRGAPIWMSQSLAKEVRYAQVSPG